MKNFFRKWAAFAENIRYYCLPKDERELTENKLKLAKADQTLKELGVIRQLSPEEIEELNEARRAFQRGQK